MSVENFTEPVAWGVASLKGCKHSLNHIGSDSLIIRGIEPLDVAVTGPRPFLFVELI